MTNPLLKPWNTPFEIAPFQDISDSDFAPAFASALAEDMACGEYFISGDQIEPMVREEVLEKCGEPTSKTGDHWYYEEQGKVLIFNADGSLETIQDADD